MSSYHQDTLLTLLGRENTRENYGFGSVSAPVFRTSTVLFENYEAFEQAMDGRYKGITYGRYGTPATHALEAALATLDGAHGAALTSGGMSAISMALTAFLQAGDHLLMVDTVYDPARNFCNGELARYGIETTYYDPLAGADIESLIKENTRVIYMEAPGSLTFEMQDIDAIVRVAKKRGIITMIDNTWATPLFFKPLAHGVDISIQSATKYIGGHSDLLVGIISFSQACEAPIRRTLKYYGVGVTPDDAFLVARGLRTLGVRLRHHEQAAMKVAGWLKGRAEVDRVLHPAFPDDPNYSLWKHYMDGASGLFAFKPAVNPSREAVARMVDGMKLFKLGFSWGGFESLVVPFYPARVRSVIAHEKDEILIRLHIGLEDVGDLLADLEAGLRRLAA